jgi:hypothetical protein
MNSFRGVFKKAPMEKNRNSLSMFKRRRRKRRRKDCEQALEGNVKKELAFPDRNF